MKDECTEGSFRAAVELGEMMYHNERTDGIWFSLAVRARKWCNVLLQISGQVQWKQDWCWSF